MFELARSGRIAMGVVMCAIAVWRFLQAAPLVFPPWVDSAHHALLVRILVEQGRIPDTWAPYLPEAPFYYHFGFHVSAALLAKLFGIGNLAQAIMITGQLWQIAAAGGVYLLCRALGPSRRTALLALILVGFVSEMPGYYLAWGRYSLLAGVTLLIFGMWAALTGRKWRLAVCVAATAVTHYYAFVHLVGFCVVLALSNRKERTRVCVSAIVGLCATAPWLARVAFWVTTLHRSVGTLPGTGGATQSSVLTMLGPSRNYALVLVALCGLSILAFKWFRSPDAASDRAMLVFAIWTIALIVLMGPWAIGPFRPDHAALLAFIPVVVFAARFLDTIPVSWLRRAAIGALLAWGFIENARVVSLKTIIANVDDKRAIHWIDVNTNRDAIILIDVERWSGLWRGSGGGAWITPMTGRKTVMPGIPYGWGFPGSRRAVDAMAKDAAALPFLLPPEYCVALEKLMTRSGAEYYYTVWPRPGQCANMRLVHKDGTVRIFERSGSRGR